MNAKVAAVAESHAFDARWTYWVTIVSTAVAKTRAERLLRDRIDRRIAARVCAEKEQVALSVGAELGGNAGKVVKAEAGCEQQDERVGSHRAIVGISRPVR